MSIPNYGKKLLKQEVLHADSTLRITYDEHKIWAPDFMESVTFIKSSKYKYQSALHFFWTAIFHEREIHSLSDAEEIFSSTHLYSIDYDAAKEKIQQCCPTWYKDNQALIPISKWIHIIWNDATDVFILFEDEQCYYAWGWDTTLIGGH
jgi:hypothetical protein